MRIIERNFATATVEEEPIMRLNENSRFIILTVGVFCLMLGAAVLLFSLIERVFFSVNFVGMFVGASSIAIALGALLLALGRRRSI
ncbi:MAG: hypothetical protein ACKVX9_04645 [Blastocatellia bacterium]